VCKNGYIINNKITGILIYKNSCYIVIKNISNNSNNNDINKIM